MGAAVAAHLRPGLCPGQVAPSKPSKKEGHSITLCADEETEGVSLGPLSQGVGVPCPLQGATRPLRLSLIRGVGDGGIQHWHPRALWSQHC